MTVVLAFHHQKVSSSGLAPLAFLFVLCSSPSSLYCIITYYAGLRKSLGRVIFRDSSATTELIPCSAFVFLLCVSHTVARMYPSANSIGRLYSELPWVDKKPVDGEPAPFLDGASLNRILLKITEPHASLCAPEFHSQFFFKSLVFVAVWMCIS